MELPPIPDAERTPLVMALLAIIDAQQQRLQTLEETVQKLRDEIAVLKGQKPKPPIAPSQLEKPTRKPAAEGDKRPGSAKRSKKASPRVVQEVKIPFADAPAGSVSKGFEPYDVQELIIQGQLTRYLRERIQLPDGSTLLAPLPSVVIPGSHFGPTLISFILNQHHQCNVTQPLLLEQLLEWGIDLSAGQLSNLLTEGQEAFHEEKADLLRAGLETASYIGVDDTGARHDGKNGYCTAIGNDLFAYFESTDSKSRLNFLQVLRGKCQGYAINDVAIGYWRQQKMPQEWLEKLSAGPACFVGAPAWQSHLAELGLTAERLVKMASEGALLGTIIELGVAPDLVILSDGAGQFNLLTHASCWVHIERPLAKVVPYGDEHRQEIEQVRQQIWDLYQDLKAYRAKPDPAAKTTLEARFDTLVAQRTVYPTSIGQVLKDMRDHKADLLRVLERPEVPLHNNASESDIRGYVKTRKISGSTRSTAGRRCRDTFTSLKKTCRKLGVSFWAFLMDRIRRLEQIPRLPDLIRQRAKESTAALFEEAEPA